MSTIRANQWLNLDGTENYKVRAWVNFNAQGTLAVRASGNVSSVTDNGVGDFTINFTVALPDTNYVGSFSRTYVAAYVQPTTSGNDVQLGAKTTTSQRIYTGSANSNVNVNWLATDPIEVNAVFVR